LVRSNFEILTRSENPVTRNLKQHRQIADALSQRDPEAIRRAVRKLLEKEAADLSAAQKRERRKSQRNLPV
jgi:DNA-binding FadR family transcriptional regulator